MQDYAAEFMYLHVGQRCEAILKFFTKTTEETKKIKKRCFFCQHWEPTAVKVFWKKILFLESSGKKEDFFPKTRRAWPWQTRLSGLTLQRFLNFLGHQHFFSRRFRRFHRFFSSTGLPQGFGSLTLAGFRRLEHSEDWENSVFYQNH